MSPRFSARGKRFAGAASLSATFSGAAQISFGAEPAFAFARVERTLLSAAFDFALVFDLRGDFRQFSVERLLRFLVALMHSALP